LIYTIPVRHEDIDVYFIDTQGLLDAEGGLNDIHIFMLANVLSATIIFNNKSILDSTNFFQFNMFIEMSK